MNELMKEDTLNGKMKNGVQRRFNKFKLSNINFQHFQVTDGQNNKNMIS